MMVVQLTAPEIYFAFRGRLVSLRRTGRTSVDDVTGRDVCHRPRANALRGLTDAFLPTGVYVYFLRLASLLFVFEVNLFVMSQPLFVYIDWAAVMSANL